MKEVKRNLDDTEAEHLCRKETLAQREALRMKSWDAPSSEHGGRNLARERAAVSDTENIDH